MGAILIPESRRPSPRGVLAAVSLAMALLAAACGGASRGDDRPRAGRLLVAAAFYPLADAAEHVGGADVDVENVTPAGGEPHDLELSPDQVDLLLDADVAVYVGGGFQPAVEEIVAGRPEGAVDVLEHADATVSGAAGTDPHVWLDPLRMARIVDAVGDALAEAHPAGAAGYRSRSEDYRAELEGLHEEYERGLGSCESRVLVTSHAAFAYLTDRYDLRQEAVAGVEPESEPSPERLAELVDLVRREGVTTVFAESTASSRVADALAREAGVKVAVLNPLEGLSEADRAAGATYVSVMRENLTALREGLRCA